MEQIPAAELAKLVEGSKAYEGTIAYAKGGAQKEKAGYTVQGHPRHPAQMPSESNERPSGTVQIKRQSTPLS